MTYKLFLFTQILVVAILCASHINLEAKSSKDSRANNPDSSFKSLFDNKTFEGWQQLGRNHKLKMGHGQRDLICYDKEFKDFDLRFEFKINLDCVSNEYRYLGGPSSLHRGQECS